MTEETEKIMEVILKTIEERFPTKDEILDQINDACFRALYVEEGIIPTAIENGCSFVPNVCPYLGYVGDAPVCKAKEHASRDWMTKRADGYCRDSPLGKRYLECRLFSKEFYRQLAKNGKIQK